MGTRASVHLSVMLPTLLVLISNVIGWSPMWPRTAVSGSMISARSRSAVRSRRTARMRGWYTSAAACAATFVCRRAAPPHGKLGVCLVTSLEKILSGRYFRQRVYPFPHVVGEDVLAPGVYRDVEEAFRAELRAGLSDTPGDGGFARTVPGYGAYVKALSPDVTGPLALCVSRAWHDMVAALWDIEATLDMDAALHHHPVGSGDGWVHNDLNPGWFVDRPRADGVNVADPELCSYQQG